MSTQRVCEARAVLQDGRRMPRGCLDGRLPDGWRRRPHMSSVGESDGERTARGFGGEVHVDRSPRVSHTTYTGSGPPGEGKVPKCRWDRGAIERERRQEGELEIKRGGAARGMVAGRPGQRRSPSKL